MPSFHVLDAWMKDDETLYEDQILRNDRAHGESLSESVLYMKQYMRTTY